MKNDAFSLIELLVVIAIIAILASIATPAYKAYVLKAKLSTLVSNIDGLVQKSIAFASQNGYFPNAGQIYAEGGQPSVTNTYASNINPLIQLLFARDVSTEFGASAPCGKAGHVSFATNTNILFPPAHHTGGTAVVNCLLANKNHILQTKCIYTYSAGFGGVTQVNGVPYVGVSQNTTSIITGLQNADGQWASIVSDFFSDASCM